MAFPPAFLDELTARNPIEDVVGQYVNLKRSGSNLFGLCPFHGEKTPSFSVAPDKGIYYCFGCHKGGNVINFEMEIEGLSYPDAVRALAKRAGMEVPEDEQYQSRYHQQERLWALHKEAARFYHSQLYAPVGANALQYAAGRGMPKSILTKFGIGYAPDSWTALVDWLRTKGYTDQELRDSGLVTVSRKNGNLFDRFRDRLMFPIIDVRGNVIGFGGRIMNNQDKSAAKYLNSPETLIFNKRKNLFALNLAKKSKLGYMILVEGYMDAIALHQFGFDCAVASLGTALTEDGANLLARYTEQVVLIYDGDEAGQNATKRAIPILEKAGLQVKVLQMRDAKDPDEYLKKFGADRFKLLLEESSNRVEYQLNAILKKYDLRDDDQKVKYLQESAELISTLVSSVQREVYGNRVAEKAGIAEDAMKQEISRAYRRRTYQEKKKQEKIDLSPVRNLQPIDKKLRYDNMKSARAEEMVLSQILKEPALFEEIPELKPEMFSSEFMGRAFSQLLGRYRQGLEVSLSGLTDFTPEEMACLAGITQRLTGPVNHEGLSDCSRTIREEYQKSQTKTLEDIMLYREKMQKSKGTKP
ncbi:MAG: DNA primase [Candidatus Faecousia sp.]|nr:DNA primase [Clostridiales bacterium]MDD5883744.1 DNA primase [Bacillota bacterium]MDY4599036.1 DNA primase [Candidatus Faecousia sp.]